ncbi:simple sugar transport system substrate-binding protein [Pseudoalteromonas translucida KMM 520]|uniref:Simple sugar transport system substrate-binding protein n=1 Tax=Pseudoalteromonas translucida KMM 520 TaxID=1315283 RepID=A0A0U2X4G6_9GAMM|nr:sugar ABC transporter substrate-binding protein [Pseudoalteromonas translucida]ALS34825.1 simple sugar transport system substrate-binding protein [Pseudoalteromonas translucida KMM 520]
MITMIKKTSTVLLATIAISGPMMTSLSAHAADEHFVMISHAPDSDSWWNTVKNAVKESADTMGVRVDYRNPSTGDLADMARIVEQSIATNPDGIIVSIADFDVLSGPLEKATRKGIPIITINSGTAEQSLKLNALMHIGQPEYEAGFGAGKKAQKAGVTSFLCVNHYITNPASVERCKGYADAIGVDLTSSMIDSQQDPSGIEMKVRAYMRSNPDTDAILAVGPTSAHPTIRALDKMKLNGKVHFSTFDLSEDIANAIKNGTIAFAIDQQPYLQGYMPVVILTLYNRYGIIQSNNINSGPGYITADNLALVEKLTGTVR